MNNIKNCILFLLLLTCGKIHAGNVDSVTINKTYKTLHFYMYGTPAYDWEEGGGDACHAGIQKKFGFDYQTKAGCTLRHLQLVRYERHNDRVENKLVKRFGDNWREQYNKELEQCR